MQYKYKRTTQSTTVKTIYGQFLGIFVASGTPTIKVSDGIGANTAAGSVFTVAGALTPGVHASSTLTGSGVISDGQVVVVGSRTYRFKTIMAQVDDVQLSGVLATDLATLKKAINGTGIAGTDYFAGTVAHALVTATAISGTTLFFVSRTTGTANNTLTTTTTSGNLAWEDTTLGGGTGTSVAGVVSNLFAINGRQYAFVAALTESYGLSAIANEILYGGSDAIALDNMKAAINASGVAGTDYSTGTTINVDVLATTNSNTQQTIEALTSGAVGNAITTTETSAGASWTGATMTGGTGSAATTIVNSFVTVAGTMYRIGPAAFKTGLFVNMTGAGDITVVYE